MTSNIVDVTVKSGQNFVKDDNIYIVYNVQEGKRKCEPRQTQKVDQKDNKVNWAEAPQRFDLREPTRAVLKLRAQCPRGFGLFGTRDLGTAEVPLWPQVSNQNYEVKFKGEDAEDGTPTATVSLTFQQPIGGTEPAEMAAAGAAVAAGGDPKAAGVVQPVLKSVGGEAVVPLEALPNLAQGEKVAIRIRPRFARNLMEPEDLAGGDDHPGPFRFVRAMVRTDTGVEEERTLPAKPPNYDGGETDFAWEEEIVLSYSAPAGRLLWYQQVELWVHACDSQGKGKTPSIGRFPMPLRQLFAQKKSSYFYRWLGLESDGGCSGYLQVDVGLAIGGSLPENAPMCDESPQELEAKCLMAPNARCETLMVSIDLFRAEDLAEVDPSKLESGTRFLRSLVGKRKPQSGDYERPALADAKVDPYAVFRVGQAEARTEAFSNIGSPVFMKRLTCPVKVPTLLTRFDVTFYDEDLARDDHVGTLHLPVRDLTLAQRLSAIRFDELELNMDVRLDAVAGDPEDEPYWGHVIDLEENKVTIRWRDHALGGPGWFIKDRKRQQLTKEAFNGRNPCLLITRHHLPKCRPRWVNIYGYPVVQDHTESARESERRNMQESSFRGRALVAVQSRRKQPGEGAEGTCGPIQKDTQVRARALAKALIVKETGDAHAESLSQEQFKSLKRNFARMAKELGENFQDHDDASQSESEHGDGRISVGALGQLIRFHLSDRLRVALVSEYNVSLNQGVEFRCEFYEVAVHVSQGFGLPEGKLRVAMNVGRDVARTEEFPCAFDGASADWGSTLRYRGLWEQGRKGSKMPDVTLHLVDGSDRETAFHRFDPRALIGQGWQYATVPMHKLGIPEKVQGEVVGWLSFAVKVIQKTGTNKTPIGSFARAAIGSFGHEPPEEESEKPHSRSYTVSDSTAQLQVQNRACPARFGVEWRQWAEAGYPAGAEVAKHVSVDPKSPEGLEFVTQKVRLNLLRGRGLNPGDDNGKSDPYVRIICPITGTPRPVESYVIEEELNPRWNQSIEFTMRIPASSEGPDELDRSKLLPSIVLEVFDKDRIGHDTFLGRAVLRHPLCSSSTEDFGELLPKIPGYWNNLFKSPSGPKLALSSEAPPLPTEREKGQPSNRMEWVQLRDENGLRAGQLLLCADGMETTGGCGPFGGGLGVAFEPPTPPEERRPTVSTVGFGSTKTERVQPVHPALHPEESSYAVSIYSAGLRKMKPMGWLGMRKPALRFRILTESISLQPGQGGIKDISGWVRDPKQKKKLKDGEVPVWEVDLPVETRHVPKLVVELTDKQFFGGSNVLAEAVVELGELHKQLQDEGGMARYPKSKTFPREADLNDDFVQRPGTVCRRNRYEQWREIKQKQRQDALQAKTGKKGGPVKSSGVDDRGMSPWFADYFDTKKYLLNKDKSDKLKQPVHMVHILDTSLEDWIHPGHSDDSRLASLPLHMTGGNSVAGEVKLRVELKPKDTPEGEVARRRPAEGVEKLEEVNVTARVYVISCSNLTSNDGIPPGKNDPYIILEAGNADGVSYRIADKEGRKANTCDPKFYKHYDIPVVLPRDCKLKVSVADWDRIGSDDTIGSTTINLDDRWYSEWRAKVPWHTETRNLYKSGGTTGVPEGTIEMWVELIRTEKIPKTPVLKIAPPPPEKYELRAVVWKVSGCIMDDTNIFGDKMTDIYVKNYLQPDDHDGKCGEQDTDTHYRSQDGEGSFNFRMKWDVTYLRHCKQIVTKEDGFLSSLEDRLFKSEIEEEGIPPIMGVELWDNDLLPFTDDFIGRVQLNLTELPTTSSLGKEELDKLKDDDKKPRGLRSVLQKLPHYQKPGHATRDVFELDPVTAQPKFLAPQETPKMWFGVYRTPTAEEKAERAKEAAKNSKDGAAPTQQPAEAAGPAADAELPGPDSPQRPPARSGKDAYTPLLDQPDGDELVRPAQGGPYGSATSRSATEEPKTGGHFFVQPDMELVGMVQMSFSICKAEDAATEKLAAGAGRAEPNQHPKLPEPERPESSFFPLFHPFLLLKHVIWKNLWQYIIGLLCILIILFALYIGFQCAIKKAFGSTSC
eukprot:Hpha_TRINITY_DN15011_c1_g3::TRINITY_DN15011_c1_g3_i4::g.126376::m.126376